MGHDNGGPVQPDFMNEITKGIGRYLSGVLPGMTLTDQYVEEDFTLPGIVVESNVASVKRRVGNRHRLYRLLFDLHIYCRDRRETRGAVETILLTLDAIDTPSGPVRARGVACNYMSDYNAVVGFNVTIDTVRAERPPEKMMALKIKERTTNPNEREELQGQRPGDEAGLLPLRGRDRRPVPEGRRDGDGGGA